jgi:uncharacterized protein (TIGR00645 family)
MRVLTRIRSHGVMARRLEDVGAGRHVCGPIGVRYQRLLPQVRAREGMERLIESVLLGMRWLLLPLYLGLLVALLAIYGMAGRELLHLFGDIASLDDTEMVLILCSLLDLVLIGNLLVMVAVSSYESYISRIAAADRGSSPEWLGKLDAGNVKVKVAVSVVMISMIHLLRAFMQDETTEHLLILAAVHAVFVASAVGVALVDRAHRDAHG